MALSGSQKGLRGSVTLRVGLGKFDGWKGVSTDRSRADIEDGQHVLSENTRLDTGMLVERPGQEKQNVDADESWEWLHDASDIGAPASEASYMTTLLFVIDKQGSGPQGSLFRRLDSNGVVSGFTSLTPSI